MFCKGIHGLRLVEIGNLIMCMVKFDCLTPSALELDDVCWYGRR